MGTEWRFSIACVHPRLSCIAPSWQTTCPRWTIGNRGSSPPGGIRRLRSSETRGKPRCEKAEASFRSPKLLRNVIHAARLYHLLKTTLPPYTIIASSRFGDTGCAVPSSWAKMETRYSSSIQRKVSCWEAGT